METPNLKEASWVVYCLVCSDGSFYIGASNNLPNRVKTHNSGKGARYTRGRLPVKVAAVSPKLTKSKALILESKVKRLPRSRKLWVVTRGEMV